jgi:hypothetical protein
VTIVAVTVHIAITEEEAHNPLMQQALSAGMATSLDMAEDQVRVASVNGVAIANSRRILQAQELQEDGVAVEFHIKAPSGDAATVNAIKASITTAVTSGATVRSIKAKAETAQVLPDSLASMVEEAPAPVMSTVTVIVTSPPSPLPTPPPTSAPTDSPTLIPTSPTAAPSSHADAPVPTPPPTLPPTEAATEAAANPVLQQLVTGGGLNQLIGDAGTGYSVGDHLHVGTAESGWTTPATIEVTAVDEAGGVTGVALVDGGVFTGEDVSGHYNLSPAQATLLMKSRESTVKNQTAKSDPRTNLAIAASATALFALVAVAVAMKRRTVSAAEAAVVDLSDEAYMLTLKATGIL